MAEAISSPAPLVTLTSGNVTVKRGTTPAGSSNACGSGTAKPCAGSGDFDNIYITLSHTADVIVPIPGVGSTVNLSG